MTVAVINPAVFPQRSTGNGVATVYPFQYKILAKTDLQVYIDGGLKTVDVDYTVTGFNLDAGGNVTFAVAPTNGAKVVIARAMQERRTTDYQQLGDFLTPQVNPDFDNPVLQIQDLGEMISRCLQFPITDALRTTTQIPLATFAGQFLAFDGSGNPVPSAGTGADAGLRADLANTTTAGKGSDLVSSRRSLAEIFAGVMPVNFAIPSHDSIGNILVKRYANNTTPGTTDIVSGVLAACAVAVQLGGGVVVFPPERCKTTAEIPRPPKVSFQGYGRDTTIIEAAHNGNIISQLNPALPAVVDDQFAFVDGIGFKTSGGSTPACAINYQNIGFTRISNVRYAAGIVIGESLHFVLNSRFDNVNNSADTGTKLVSASVADGTNLNKFTNYLWSANATLGTSINGHGSYQVEFDTCCWFSQPTRSLDHFYSAKTSFINCTWEGNTVNTVRLLGGDSIIFKRPSQIDPLNLIDVASFGARNVVIEEPLGWVQSVQPPWPVHDEITVRDPTYTLDEAAGIGNTDEAHYLTEGHSTTGRQFANFPSYAAGSAFYADSHITPLGGDIPTGAYNRIGSFDFTNGAQWSTVGTGGATDPFGGTTAYNLNNIASTQNGGNGLGAAATGRTFTFQLWAKFVGRVRLGIGTTNLGIIKRANFYSTTANWRLLSVTYTSGVDVGTTPLCNILTSQNTVGWRPCHYESFGPLPALQPNRNLANVVGPIRVEDTRITVFGNAIPAAGAFTAGDTTEQSAPIVGNPKRWRFDNTATWRSEGNL